uniref:protein-tyrosine-phosphatase n=1 Tax=Hemiselmis andersenii TaxID=464988 RepID=A0A6T8N459_HEMAN|mmetsp:Transcript_2976/g.6777  ORF Transcript_2976/g.6777 Transcript_2976/m.6777 type:complete len:483 (+) Transcript_2976:249-1697(+)
MAKVRAQESRACEGPDAMSPDQAYDRLDKMAMSLSIDGMKAGEAPMGLQEDAALRSGTPSSGSSLCSTGHNTPVEEHKPAHRGSSARDDGWPNVQPDLAWEEGAHYTVIPATADRGGLYYSPHCDDEYTLQAIKSNTKLFYFSNDLPERYLSFCADWGPVNIGLIIRFCKELRAKWEHPRLLRRPLVYYSSPEPQRFTNTAMMLASYLMFDHDRTPEEAIYPFARIGPTPFECYRDATWATSTFDLHALSCLKGLRRAADLGWLGQSPIDHFDVAEYETYDDPRAYNLHLITPKFIAFLGPQDRKPGLPWGVFQHEPSEYVQEFRSRGVKAVVRLNEPGTYDKGAFERHGIVVHDLEFQDCTTPSADIVKRFLDCVDTVDGPVAIHCLAGLGRTGTLIAVHMMKHSGFTAREAIGYLRIMRPGSVIGPQQQYLEMVQRATWDGNTVVMPEGSWGEVRADDCARMASEVAQAVRNGRAQVDGA